MKSYGTSQDLVTFYVKHGFLDRACELIVQQSLGAKVSFGSARSSSLAACAARLILRFACAAVDTTGLQVFFNEVLAPCMDNGALPQLRTAMQANEAGTTSAARCHAKTWLRGKMTP